MAWLTDRLTRLGYRWAYRVIDARAFGLAQRRRRLFILGSRVSDPSEILFGAACTPRLPDINCSTPHGFYWTEGNRGVGWAPDAIPPLKCSSGLGIASPPAIWLPHSRSIVTPSIQDAEALQGFRRGWTREASTLPGGERARWRLVGNAVSVPISEWIGRRLNGTRFCARFERVELAPGDPWPSAACGSSAARYEVAVSEWPARRRTRGIMEFLSSDAPPLSAKATGGFYSRLIQSRLRVPQRFLEDLAFHLQRCETHAKARPSNEQKNVSNSRARQRKGAPVKISAV
jgi:DNA (cytosine-5)-methyltransferase 1